MRSHIIKFLVGLFLLTGVSFIVEKQAFTQQKDPVTKVKPKKDRLRERDRSKDRKRLKEKSKKNKRLNKKKMHKKNIHKRVRKRIHKGR